MFLPELSAGLRQKITGEMRLDARKNVVSVVQDNGGIFSIIMSQLMKDKDADVAAELENIAIERALIRAKGKSCTLHRAEQDGQEFIHL